jgi:oxygen-independent coproporphyrinogen-3 oxidase
MTTPDFLKDIAVVGCLTPDPLRFGFSVKSHPHAGKIPSRSPILKEVDYFQSYISSNTSPRCLYLHVPFCRVRCTYCGFFQNVTKPEEMTRYVKALLQEIHLKSKWIWAQSQPFDAVYLGGGTPTDLSAEQIGLILRAIQDAFPLAKNCEITLEGRIHRFSDEKLLVAVENGVNRFSFGIQSFDTRVRRAANRLDDGDKVLARLQTLTSLTNVTVVMDLLYGLPHQDRQIWQDDVSFYQESGADGVDLYQLIHLKGLPMQTLIDNGRLPAPANSAERASFFEFGVNAMNEFHPHRLSNNHWATSTKERSLYNHLAKSGAEILPIGAGAGGGLAGWHWMQSRDLSSYYALLDQQQIPAIGMIPLSPHHQAWGKIKGDFDRGQLNVSTFADLDDAQGCLVFSALLPLFDAWQSRGFIALHPDSVTLTLAGQFWAVNLTQILLDCLQAAFEMDCAA